jgi:uncharacterized membrane protein
MFHNNWLGHVNGITLGLGFLAGLLLLVGLIVAIFWIIRKFKNQNNIEQPVQVEERVIGSSKEVVQNRYAKGDISREEYLQLMTDLGE